MKISRSLGILAVIALGFTVSGCNDQKSTSASSGQAGQTAAIEKDSQQGLTSIVESSEKVYEAGKQNAKETVDDVSSRLKEGASKSGQEIRKVGGQVTEKATELSQEGKVKSREAASAVKEGYENTKNQTAQKIEELGGRVGDASKDLSEVMESKKDQIKEKYNR